MMNFILKVVFEALAFKLHLVIAPKQTTLLSADGFMESFGVPVSCQKIKCCTTFLFCVVSTCTFQIVIPPGQINLTILQTFFTNQLSIDLLWLKIILVLGFFCILCLLFFLSLFLILSSWIFALVFNYVAFHVTLNSHSSPVTLHCPCSFFLT